MSIQILHPRGWLPPVGYANGISVAAGRIVFIAGQVGWDANQKFQSEELVPQFEQALKNIIAILAEAGGKPSAHLQTDRILHRQARLPRGPARARTHLEIADRKSLPGDEHDFCCRSARHSGKDRAGSDRCYSRAETSAGSTPRFRRRTALRVRRRASAAAATRR